jgi:Rad3-related DNA helicase
MLLSKLDAVLHVQPALGRSSLSGFKRSVAGVLVAPSMDRGVDLADDLCRVVVIAKVPFPYLGDRQVSARLHSPGGQTWYNVQTIRSIVQMTGRATRHSSDRSTSYILDSQFERQVWWKGRQLFPGWWTDALDWRRPFGVSCPQFRPLIHKGSPLVSTRRRVKVKGSPKRRIAVVNTKPP